MQPPNAPALTGRLDAMEIEVRRLRGLAAALVVATLVLGGHAALSRPRPGRPIVAGSVEIRSQDGKLRGTFGVDHDGLPGLKLYDHRGLEQVTLAIPSDDYSALYFMERGGLRLALESSLQGASSIRLVDKHAQVRALVDLAPDGTSQVATFDASDESPSAAPIVAEPHAPAAAPAGAPVPSIADDLETVPAFPPPTARVAGSRPRPQAAEAIEPDQIRP
jgi:hypothetical protein